MIECNRFVRYLAVGMVLFSTSVCARDIFVSTSGNDGNSGDSPERALRTIAAASSRAQPGDVVQILPGRYEEPIKPARSGTSGKPITYRSYGPAPAVLTHSKVRGLNPAILIDGTSYIVVDGIHIDGVKPSPNARVGEFVKIGNANHVVIRRGTFKYAHGWAGIAVVDGASYVTIEDNDIDFVGQYDNGAGSNTDTGDIIYVAKGSGAHHVLVQRNTIRHGGHNLIAVHGNQCIIQENYLDNSWRDVLGGQAGGRVGAIMGVDNVFQHNYVTGSGASSDNPVNPMVKIQGRNTIARFNVFVDGVSEGISSDSQPEATQLRIYHNTFYGLGAAAWRMEAYSGDAPMGNNVFMNNLVVDSRRNPANGNYDTDVMFKVQKVNKGATAGSRVYSNLFQPAGGKAPRFLLQGYDGFVELARVQEKYPDLFSGNKQARGEFVSATPKSLADFALRAGSPGVDAASYLTRVVGSGRGNVLKVADSRFFTDGQGLVPGDLIQLEASTERVRVTGVDHSTGTLRLASEIDFADGKGVSLTYEGAAPDIGAREHAGAVFRPSAPTGLRIEK